MKSPGLGASRRLLGFGLCRIASLGIFPRELEEMKKRVSKTSIFRILPAAFVGLLPFTLLDGALLKNQYSLRGQRDPSSRLSVVLVNDHSHVRELVERAHSAGFTHCVSFLPREALGGASGLRCETVRLAQRYDLQSIEKLWPRWRSSLGPHPLPEKTGNYYALFMGPLSSFKPVYSRAIVQTPGRSFNPGDILVLLPASAQNPSSLSPSTESALALVPIATPAGTMNPYEVALNVLSNAADGTQLIHAPRWAQFVLSISSAALVAWILYTYPIFMTLVFTLIVAALEFVVAMIVFDKAGFQLPLAAPLLSLVTIYLLGMSDRLDRRERREWAVQQEADNLRQLDEMRNNFLSLVSHDLKTPIARMQSVLERFLRGDFGVLSPQQLDSMNKVVSASGHLQRTISTLLLLSRIESREIRIQPEPTDLAKLLEEVAQHNAPAAADRRIELKFELEPLFLVDLDQALIREVANNLIDNALKYSPSGSTVHIRCGELENCPELSPPQPGLWFEVQDQGPGIPSDDRSRVLEKFVQARVELISSDQSIKGTGLGLYLASFFVGKHGGRLSLFSKVPCEKLEDDDPTREYFAESESGTVVRVSLPIDLSPEQLI